MSLIDGKTEPAAPPAPRRWRRRIFRIAVVLAVIFAGLVGWAYYVGGTALRRAMAEADRLDPGWQVTELEAKRREIPDAENSALVLMNAKKLVNRAAFNQSYHEQDEVLRDLTRQPTRRANEAQKKALAVVLTPYRPVLPEYRKLAELSWGRYPIKYSADLIGTLLECQSSRDAASALRYDLLERVEANDRAGAADAVRGLLNAARSIGDEPLAISMLVRIACAAIAAEGAERFLAQFEADDATLARLQAEFEREAAAPLLLTCARGERAFGFGCLEFMKSNRRQLPSLGRPPNFAARDLWMYVMMFLPGGMDVQQGELLRHMNRFVEAAKLPTEQQADAIRDWNAASNELPPLARLLAPALVKMTEAYHRGQAKMRCVAVAIAAERYRLRHGRWPAAIEELVGDRLLAEVPADPFVGRPLKWKETAEGRLVYSVGKDKADDGGKVDPEKASVDGYDLGIRLYEPRDRGQRLAEIAKPAGESLPDGNPK